MEYLGRTNAAQLKQIEDSGELTDETEREINEAIEDYVNTYKAV